jgi:hypothetical protein
VVLEDERRTESFYDQRGARSICGDRFETLTFPNDPKIGHNYEHAAAGEAGLKGGAWKLNTAQVRSLPIDVAVNLKPRSATVAMSTQGGSHGKMTEKNTRQKDNTLYTCSEDVMSNNREKLGCLEITFKKAAPEKVTILSGVAAEAGRFKEEGWNADGYWLCEGHGANNFNRICPAETTVSAYKGVSSCGPEVDTVDELEAKMNSENAMKKWVLRACGFLLFWCAISMCFQPIETILELATDCLDSATECIPCVGCCVDTITDVFMGVVKCILCLVSFCCGGACFLFVCAVMWVAMRPVQGSIMLVIVLTCCIGGYCLLNSSKDPSKSRKKRRDVPLANYE